MQALKYRAMPAARRVVTVLRGLVTLRAVKRPRALAAAVTVVAAAGALALTAAPAEADSSAPTVGCVSGSSCFIELSWHVTYSGSTGGSNGVVVKPPPCIGLPFGDAHIGSEAVINTLYADTAPVAQPSSPPPVTDTASPSTASPDASATGSPAIATVTPTATASTPPSRDLTPQQQAIVDKAKQLVKTDPIAPGEWYQVENNPNASASDQRQCANLPPYIWEAGNSNVLRVGGLDIPAETLAGLAYNQLSTAQLGTPILDPQGASDTNLPTFVQVPLKSTTGALTVTAQGTPYVYASAETPDGTAATVYAEIKDMSITPGSDNAQTWNDARCVQAHLSADNTYLIGSRYSAAEMAAVGAGQKIDCGVTYTAPGTFNLSVSVDWTACWAPGLPVAAEIPANCKPVPGAAGLAPSTTPSTQVTVRDIQSVNNG